MSTQDKLINRFIGLPKDFSFDELSKLLIGFGYEKNNKGKTSGSRVRFINKELKLVVDLHKPHTSGSPIKEMALKDIYNNLLTNGLIKEEKEEDKL
jgi:hypothetical protein